MRVQASGLIALTVLLLSTSAALAQQRATDLVLQADGDIRIGADGTVLDYTLHSPLAPAIATLVDARVRAWHFEPILVDGKPVPASTAMHLSLLARALDNDADGNYNVRVEHIRFGEMKAASGLAPPKYPSAAVHARLGARVLLAVQLDAEGRVVEAMPYQTSLDARAATETDAERWRLMFEHASIAAVKTWHYDLSERIDGKPIGTRAMVPINFTIAAAGDTREDGKWKAYVPGPIHPTPWAGSDAADAQNGLAALHPGQGMALDSRFHLREDVIGKTL